MRWEFVPPKINSNDFHVRLFIVHFILTLKKKIVFLNFILNSQDVYACLFTFASAPSSTIFY